MRKLNLSTLQVTTVAGQPTGAAYADGVGAAARFGTLNGISLDGAGNLYVADGGSYYSTGPGNDCVRKVVLATGSVSTVVGSPYANYVDGTGAAASLRDPAHLCQDPAGNVYFTSSYGFHVSKLDAATGQVTNVAGAGIPGRARRYGH